MKVFHGLKEPCWTIFIGKTHYSLKRKEHLAQESSEERSIWHRKQALGFLRMIGFFLNILVPPLQRWQVGRLALLLGSGLSSEVNKEGRPPSQQVTYSSYDSFLLRIIQNYQTRASPVPQSQVKSPSKRQELGTEEFHFYQSIQMYFCCTNESVRHLCAESFDVGTMLYKDHTEPLQKQNLIIVS